MNAESHQQFIAALEDTHGRALRRFLAARVRHSSADVPDLVQEVFLRLLRIPEPESIRNPQAYLYTVASHVLHQYTLRCAITAAPLELADITAELEAALDSDPAEAIQLEQRFELLRKGLEELSPRAYSALLMYRCEGMTLEKIGERLGVSRVMAKKYLVKAMTYCHHRLQEMD